MFFADFSVNSLFSTEFDAILQGVFSSLAATTVKFSLENIVGLAKKLDHLAYSVIQGKIA